MYKSLIYEISNTANIFSYFQLLPMLFLSLLHDSNKNTQMSIYQSPIPTITLSNLLSSIPPPT